MTMLGIGLGIPHDSGVTSLSLPLRLGAALFSEWDDQYMSGVVLDTAPTPDEYVSIPNRGSYGGSITYAAGKRPDVATLGDGALQRRYAAYVSGDQGLHNGTAATWTKAHQEWTFYFVVFPNTSGSTTVIAATAANANEVGMVLRVNGSNGKLSLNLHNGSGTNWFYVQTGTGVNLDQINIVVVRYSQAYGYRIEANGVSLANGSLPGAPPSAAASRVLSVGAYGGGYTGTLDGDLMHISGFPTVHSDTTVEAMRQWLWDRWHPWQIYLASGQSNCVGGGLVADLTTMSTPDTRGRLWYKFNDPVDDDSSGWITLQGRDSNVRFGGWLPFAHALLDRGRRTALVIYAVNGSLLNTRWKPSAADLYPNLVIHMTAALGAFTEPYDLRGLVWIHGEGDAGGPVAAGAYAANLTDFMTALRTDSGVANLELVFNHLNTYSVILPYLTELRAQQTTYAAADSYASLVEYNTAELLGDNVHFNSTGHEVIGYSLAAAVA